MWRYTLVALICSLVWMALFLRYRASERAVVERYSDSITVVRVDTLRIIEPPAVETHPLSEVVEVVVVDTIYMVDTIYRERVLYLPRQQRHYADSGVYDLWVSGVEPILDSISIYSRHEITTVATTSSPSKLRGLSLYGSLRLASDGTPAIGMLVTSRGSFAYGVEVSMAAGGDPTYSFTLAYRIFGR
ncbi:MAG: DUF6808 domain-containing protein [Rikenellaceae bacterium]